MLVRSVSHYLDYLEVVRISSSKLSDDLKVVKVFEQSEFKTNENGAWRLAVAADKTDDHVWLLQKDADATAYAGMTGGIEVDGDVGNFMVGMAFPATFSNLLVLKNLILSYDDKVRITHVHDPFLTLALEPGHYLPDCHRSSSRAFSSWRCASVGDHATCAGTLKKQSLGLGARFTALHYPATGAPPS
jgi:hypothetical protein